MFVRCCNIAAIIAFAIKLPWQHYFVIALIIGHRNGKVPIFWQEWGCSYLIIG